MALYALSDTHLSFAKDKPMDIFDEIWKNHPQKIKENWLQTITDEDTVLLPGDISWAINYRELEPDMDFLLQLPGKKIISPGNHDYWWNSTQRLNEMYSDKNVTFVKSDFYAYGELAICAAKGWVCPNDTRYTSHDEKLYRREVARLKMALDSAVNKGYNNIMVMMHFPPTNDKKERSEFVDLLENYGVKRVIYGHLHSNRSYNSSYQGVVNGIEYTLVSCDYRNFVPQKIEI
jgi:hypothetical protein